MDKSPKQQVIEKMKVSNNILIVVSEDPSVDQLATAIGMTLMLNKLKKHVVAVYSGETPRIIEFLKPGETIEKNTDSLQDFIISLDRSKADKLRYKVENDVVKIFITPYRTGITEDDLQFAQGDFNVDVVIALGVDERDHLDNVIISHGQILHDAVVTSMMAGSSTSSVGSINWQEPAVSSLAEMAVKVSDALQPGILDAQMSTAFLTGIVSETERFKNERTTSKVMTISAQLVASGADPKLVAENLEGLVASIIDDNQSVQGQPTEADDQPGGAAAQTSARPAEVITLDTSDEVKNIQLRDEAEEGQGRKIDYIHIDKNGHLSRVDEKQPDAAQASPPKAPTLGKDDPQKAVKTPKNRVPPQSVVPPPPVATPPDPENQLPPSPGLGERMRRLAGNKTVFSKQPPPTATAPPSYQPGGNSPPPAGASHNYPFPAPQPPSATTAPPSATTAPPLGNDFPTQQSANSTPPRPPPPTPKPDLGDARQRVDQALMNGSQPSSAASSLTSGAMAPPPLLPPPPVISHP